MLSLWLNCYFVKLLLFLIKLNLMITKSQLLNTLNKMPENLVIEDLIDKLIFMEKIQKGIEDSKNGKIHTKEQAKQKLDKWFK